MSAAQDVPFRAIVGPGNVPSGSNAPDETARGNDEAWSADDLEAAYQRALAAAEMAEILLPAEVAGTENAPIQPVDHARAFDAEAGTAVREGAASSAAVETARPSATPRQVLEALLFVGGEPLTGKRLADLLGGGFNHDQVDELIAEINRRYFDEGRPYEVRLAEGGYRLELLSEFEPVRSRVYGQGPRDVKLSQDVLEVLAFIAYRQPIDQIGIEETGKSNAGAILRQLLRRELISLERVGDDEPIRYRTTRRFLELFGLRDIEDLPQPDDLMFK
jgi:segregation and condensation protein B